MTKFLLGCLAAAILIVAAVPANAQGLIPGLSANPITTLTCGIPFFPAQCTRLDHIVGGAIDGAVLGFGVGAIVGAGGGVVASGGAFAGAGTTAVALSGMGLGAAVGAGAGAVPSLAPQ